MMYCLSFPNVFRLVYICMSALRRYYFFQNNGQAIGCILLTLLSSRKMVSYPNCGSKARGVLIILAARRYGTDTCNSRREYTATDYITGGSWSEVGRSCTVCSTAHIAAKPMDTDVVGVPSHDAM